MTKPEGAGVTLGPGEGQVTVTNEDGSVVLDAGPEFIAMIRQVIRNKDLRVKVAVPGRITAVTLPKPASTDRLAGLGLTVAFIGGLALWWQAAIICLGLTLFLTAVAQAYLRRDRAAEEHHEG